MVLELLSKTTILSHQVGPSRIGRHIDSSVDLSVTLLLGAGAGRGSLELTQQILANGTREMVPGKVSPDCGLCARPPWLFLPWRGDSKDEWQVAASLFSSVFF